MTAPEAPLNAPWLTHRGPRVAGRRVDGVVVHPGCDGRDLPPRTRSSDAHPDAPSDTRRRKLPARDRVDDAAFLSVRGGVPGRADRPDRACAAVRADSEGQPRIRRNRVLVRVDVDGQAVGHRPAAQRGEAIHERELVLRQRRLRFESGARRAESIVEIAIDEVAREQRGALDRGRRLLGVDVRHVPRERSRSARRERSASEAGSGAGRPARAQASASPRAQARASSFRTPRPTAYSAPRSAQDCASFVSQPSMNRRAAERSAPALGGPRSAIHPSSRHACPPLASHALTSGCAGTGALFCACAQARSIHGITASDRRIAPPGSTHRTGFTTSAASTTVTAASEPAPRASGRAARPGIASTPAGARRRSDARATRRAGAPRPSAPPGRAP